MSAPTSAITTIVTANRMARLMISVGISSTAPVWPKSTVLTNIETNVATMKTSPWAKLMSSMIP